MNLRLIPGALSRYCDKIGMSRNQLARRIGVAPETAYRVDHNLVAPGNYFIAALMNEVGGLERTAEFFEIEGAAA